MPKLTIIARVVDGLPLAASMEDDKYHRDLDVYKNQAKRIFKQLSSASPGRLSIESGSEIFQCAPAKLLAFCCPVIGFVRRRRPCAACKSGTAAQSMSPFVYGVVHWPFGDQSLAYVAWRGLSRSLRSRLSSHLYPLFSRAATSSRVAYAISCSRSAPTQSALPSTT